MKKLIATLYLLSLPTFAFLNIESLRQNNRLQNGLKGTIGFSLLDQSGNVDKTLIGAKTLNLYQKDQNQFIFLSNYRYGESFGDKDTQEGNLHFRYTRLINDWLGWESFQQTEFNKFQDLKLRLLFGTGARFQLVDQTHHRVHFGLGSFYEREELEETFDQKNPRMNTYLSYLYKGGDFEISSTLYYQPNIENFNDYRFRASLGLETTFSESFSQTIQYQFNRDTAPPPGIENDDRSLTAGLNYRY